jgi:hypothetical protein
MIDKKENKFFSLENILQAIGIIIILRLTGMIGGFAFIVGSFVYKKTKLKYQYTKLKYKNTLSLLIGSLVGIIVYVVIIYLFTDTV